MAECIADYYTDKNKILTMLEYGNPKERQIALGSLAWNFRKENHYELAWRIFLSDEHIEVKEKALSLACEYATQKQLYEIIDFILQDKLKLNQYNYYGRSTGPKFERVILWGIYHREKIYQKLYKK